MLPNSDYVHSEQFDTILVTTNSTVYEQRNSSSLLPSRSTYSTHRQQKTRVTLSMSYACQHISRKPPRISRTAQTPQTGSSTVARGSLHRGPCCSRVVLCTNLQRKARWGAFRTCANFFFFAQTNGYQSVSIFRVFWASRQLYNRQIYVPTGDSRSSVCLVLSGATLDWLCIIATYDTQQHAEATIPQLMTQTGRCWYQVTGKNELLYHTYEIDEMRRSMTYLVGTCQLELLGTFWYLVQQNDYSATIYE